MNPLRLPTILLVILVICNSVSAINAVESSGLPIYNLYITEDNMRVLEDDLNLKTKNTTDVFRSGEFTDVKGKLMYDDVVYKVKAGYRGDTRVHWAYPKKSWRIKLRDNKSIDMTKNFNLLNPKHYNQFTDYLTYVTAEKFGLLSPRTDFVILNINNEYYGVYQYVEQTDSHFLHARRRIPNDIYNGDVIYTSTYYYLGNLSNITLWNTPDVWTKQGKKHESFDELKYLLDVLKDNSTDKFSKLGSILDIDKYLRLMALIDHVNSNHIDESHNHKLYFNPSSGRFEPIVWDIGGFGGYSKVNPNEVADSISRVIYDNPEWIATKNRYLWECIHSHCSAENLSREFMEIYNKTYSAYVLDERRSFGLGERFPLTGEDLRKMPSDFNSWLTKNNRIIEDKLSMSNFTVNLIKVNDTLYMLTFIVDDESGIEIENMQIPSNQPVHIYRDINLNFSLDEKDPLQGLYKSSNGVVNISDPILLYSSKIILEDNESKVWTYHNVPTYYNFFIKTQQPIDEGKTTIKIVNMVTRNPVMLIEQEEHGSDASRIGGLDYPTEMGIAQRIVPKYAYKLSALSIYKALGYGAGNSSSNINISLVDGSEDFPGDRVLYTTSIEDSVWDNLPEGEIRLKLPSDKGFREPFWIVIRGDKIGDTENYKSVYITGPDDKDNECDKLLYLPENNSWRALNNRCLKFSLIGEGTTIDYVNASMKELEIQHKSNLPSYDTSITANAISYDVSRSKIIENINLSGEIILRENLVVERNQVLYLSPGTVVRLYPNISIIVHGQIIANGTEEQPIWFMPYDSNSPWGSLAIQGVGQNQDGILNYLNHCIFKNGSVVTYGRVYYSGMVNAHYTRLNVDNCIFKRNMIGDDNFHAVKSTVIINNSQFLDSNSDGIDFDFNDGIITNSFFNNSGNDAIDLMGSDALILNNLMVGSGDKGISIGEKSNPKIINNTFTGNSIGIEIKDMSNPLIENVTITQSERIGVHGYRKNMIYDYGGRGIIRNSLVIDNEQDFLMDGESYLQIEDNSPTDMMTRIMRIFEYYKNKLKSLL